MWKNFFPNHLNETLDGAVLLYGHLGAPETQLRLILLQGSIIAKQAGW